MPKFIDLTGRRYHRWTVLNLVQSLKNTTWRCRCDCGVERDVQAGNLTAGVSRSCGCVRREVTAARSTTHGAARGRVETAEYQTWKHMKTRCLSPRCQDYPYYGGRGITICDEWVNDFGAFVRDMGPRPRGYTLDRRDVNGPYSPDNCRWATRKTQSNNTRRCIFVMHKGKRLTLKELAASYGVPYPAMLRRVRGHGQTPEQALFAILNKA